jgi:hypothetical protein
LRLEAAGEGFVELEVGESTPRAMFVAARTPDSYRVLARFNRRDSEPFELHLDTDGATIEVRCDACGMSGGLRLRVPLPVRGVALVRARGGAEAALLSLEAAPGARALPPEGYSPAREETP